jgi:hypothetical protein
MYDINFRAVGAGAGTASHYGSSSGSAFTKTMGLLAAPAPQYCFSKYNSPSSVSCRLNYRSNQKDAPKIFLGREKLETVLVK